MNHINHEIRKKKKEIQKGKSEERGCENRGMGDIWGKLQRNSTRFDGSLG